MRKLHRKFELPALHNSIMLSSPIMMIAYFSSFGFIHSLLADTRAKKAVMQALGPAADKWYRLTYVILALVMVLPFFYILALMPDRILYMVSSPWSWLMMAGQALCFLAIVAALKQTGFLYFFGLSQPFLPDHGEAANLVTDGFYCRLRNPLFFFGTVFLWLYPFMTVNLLTFNVLATIYFYIGALHEERSLQEEFGQPYIKYRKQVPMFIPRIRCNI